MRAVVVTEYGGPEVLTVTEVPDPEPGPDEILVRVAHSAINRADTLQRQGGYPDPHRREHEILGLEFAGTVEATGERVTLWQVGDRVMGIEAGACYAERVVTHERQALPIPATVDLVDAAAIPEVFLTAWDALVVQGGLTSGRWALVHAGASGVGTAAIQIATAIGARVAVTCSARKMDACRDLGADLVLERSPADWARELKSAVPGGVDVVLDVVGGDEVNRNLASVRPQGTIVQVGLMGGRRHP
jgi:NADPH:quinone reductase-like Zn-dependent oxidoreductase